MAILPSSSRLVMSVRLVRSPFASASITSPSRRTGRRIERRASGTEMPTNRISPASATRISSNRVLLSVLAMSRRPCSVRVATWSPSAPISSSVVLLRVEISPIRSVTELGSSAALLTKSLMKALKLVKSARSAANWAARPPGRFAAATASAASVADWMSSAVSLVTSTPSAAR